VKIKYLQITENSMSGKQNLFLQEKILSFIPLHVQGETFGFYSLSPDE
jgi:hypothetical protein